MGAVVSCERSHWDILWSSLWDHETCEECADMGAVVLCERNHWRLRWNSLWGHHTRGIREGRAE
eukprot:7713837-Pyramimonas_sp.AAC.1